MRRMLLMLLHKRTLNQDVVSGAGEAYAFLWTRSHAALPTSRIAGTLKDNLIASSIASWLAILLLLALAGPVLLATLLTGRGLPYLIAAAALGIVLLALGIRYRHSVFTLGARAMAALVGVHLGRTVLFVYLLQVVQWWLVAPEAPLHLWAAMLVVAAVVNRVPFLPARDLVGIGAVLDVLALPAAYEATIAAMLLTRTALDKACNLLVVVVHHAWDQVFLAPPRPGTP